MNQIASRARDSVGARPAGGSMSPAEIGRRLGVSEDAVVSLLTMLAREGRVRIRAVESVEPRALAA